MKNKLIKLGVSSLVTLAILAGPISTGAQTSTNAPAASEPVTKPKKHEFFPFHGKVSAVDTKAKTLKVGNLILEVSGQTHITKDGQPATLDQGVVGEAVTGAYRKSADGKLHAVSIHYGAHAEKKRKELDASTTTGTNSPAK
jgi:hypothetical protein